jgi:outer membrane protein OmpA-like peptidoglycan-associated protein
MRAHLAALLLLAGATASAGAQEMRRVEGGEGKVLPLVFEVRDLVFGENAVAGAVADLEVKETPTEIHIELAADVLFDFDKADILPKAEDTLKKAAALIAERGSDRTTVRIEGHTDAKGDDAYNQRLSERRAQSVASWFSRQGGLGGFEFQSTGKGETQPVAPNTRTDGSDDPEGRQKNRRVEIVVKKG